MLIRAEDKWHAHNIWSTSLSIKHFFFPSLHGKIFPAQYLLFNSPNEDLLPNAFVIAVINDVDVEITEMIRMAAAAGCGVGGYHDMKVK